MTRATWPDLWGDVGRKWSCQKDTEEREFSVRDIVCLQSLNPLLTDIELPLTTDDTDTQHMLFSSFVLAVVEVLKTQNQASIRHLWKDQIKFIFAGIYNSVVVGQMKQKSCLIETLLEHTSELVILETCFIYVVISFKLGRDAMLWWLQWRFV